MFLMVLRALYHCRDEQRCLAEADRIIGIFRYFLEDAQPLFDKLPDYVMGEHRKHLKGGIGTDHEGSKAPPLPQMPAGL